MFNRNLGNFGRRVLQDSIDDMLEGLKDGISVTRISSSDDSDQNDDDVSFTWEMSSFTAQGIEFQIVWDDPYKVSSGTGRDTLIVEVDMSSFDETSEKPIKIIMNIPKQLPDTPATHDLEVGV